MERCPQTEVVLARALSPSQAPTHRGGSVTGSIRNYEIIKELGAGHFGTVFMAVGQVPGRGLSAGTRRLVAIKKLNRQSNAESATQLLREFALLDQVKHRGIVRVFEYIPEERAVVMELVHGVTLRQVLDECIEAHEQVFTEAVVEIACEIADALYQAYTTPGDDGEALRLVHRDLKPENIMLGPSAEVKILDFGLARVDNTDFASEEPGRVRGTPIYMAPEQARGEAVDHRTDIFALGLITYEMLMNRPVYGAPDTGPNATADIYDAIERAHLEPITRELERKIPSMGKVLARCLQARPRDRYQTGQELMVDLRRKLYRDRGAYLQEFCEFFFGAIHQLEDLPSISSATQQGSARRMTMEERLRRSMELEQQARESPQARGSSPPLGRRQVWRPPQTPPSAAPPSIDQHPVPAMAPPPCPPASGRSSKPKVVGARHPDETGMLPIVPLTSADSPASTADDPSATQFFAIPAPKVAQAPKPRPSPATPPSAPPSMAGQPPAPPKSPPPAIRGPVASDSAPASGSPFQEAGTKAPPPAAEASGRVQSNRVYAVILAMMFLTGAAIVAAVWLRPTFSDGDLPTDPRQDHSTISTRQASNETSPALIPDDTAEDEPPPPPRRRATTTSSSSTTKKTTSASSGQTATSKPVNPASVSIKILDDSPIYAIEVVCPGGFRERGNVSSRQASIANVPQESCTMYFKGVPAQFHPVSGGMNLSCSIQGSTAVCK